MESKLARQLQDDLIAAIGRLSPEDRLKAFLAHCRLVTELYEAGRRHRARPSSRRPFSRAITVPFQGQPLRVIGREDFIAMQTFTGGPADMMDARAVIRVAGESLDLTLLRRLAEGYGRSTRDALEAMLRD